MNRRPLLMAGALAATLLLTLWTARLPDDTTAPVARPAEAERLAPLALQRAAWPRASVVALVAWSAPATDTAVEPDPAPAAGPAAEPAPPPQAEAPLAPPPFPWRWLGRLDDATGPQALLDGPDGARLVRERDVLDGQWRVDRITPDQLRWTWLPAGLPHTLNRS